MICGLENDVWWNCFPALRENISTRASDYVLNGGFNNKRGFSERCQILNILTTLAAADEPHLQLSLHLLFLFFLFCWPTLPPSPSAPASHLRTHLEGVIPPACNPLPTRVGEQWFLQLIPLYFPREQRWVRFSIKEKDLVSSIKKKMSWAFELCPFILTPPHVVSATAQCWSGMNREVLLPPYFRKCQPILEPYVGCLSEVRIEQISSAAVRILYKVVFLLGGYLSF